MRKALMKLKWSWKLMCSPAFVVMTDREAAIMIDDLVPPETIQDQMTLDQQVLTINQYMDSLQGLLNEHELVRRRLNRKEGNEATKITVQEIEES